mmetsp:Transcript_6987/g.20522  ORF Transcript_6987/g.20522 Transcript_6987/m.20522 type:complete len:260 (-) Transcript_6987:3308-4087(-)
MAISQPSVCFRRRRRRRRNHQTTMNRPKTTSFSAEVVCSPLLMQGLVMNGLTPLSLVVVCSCPCCCRHYRCHCHCRLRPTNRPRMISSSLVVVVAGKNQPLQPQHRLDLFLLCRRCRRHCHRHCRRRHSCAYPRPHHPCFLHRTNHPRTSSSSLVVAVVLMLQQAYSYPSPPHRHCHCYCHYCFRRLPMAASRSSVFPALPVLIFVARDLSSLPGRISWSAAAASHRLRFHRHHLPLPPHGCYHPTASWRRLPRSTRSC